MSETKHTPGEWKSEVVGTNSGHWIVVYVDDPIRDGGKRELFESETVRTAVGRRNTLTPRFRDTKDAAEIRANVALAKAAPDMLAALKAFSLFSAMIGKDGRPSWFKDDGAWTEFVIADEYRKAAIAKAGTQ